MKVVHFSCRLSEGGAARVATDIIENASSGVEHAFVYGYSRGGRPSPRERLLPNVLRVGGRAKAAANMAAFRLFGEDIFGPAGKQARRLNELVQAADVIHVHGIHSYYMPLGSFRSVALGTDKPVVITTHDFWWLTGRCAFVEGCERWRSGCISCPGLSNYPPAYLDNAADVFPRKRRLIDLLGDRVCFVSPACFLERLHREAFPHTRSLTIRNGASREFVRAACEADWGQVVLSRKTRVSVVAADFRDHSKTDHALVERLSREPELELHLVGSHADALRVGRANVHGEVRERDRLASLLLNTDVLVFSSLKDICPLVVLEASVLGLIVVCLSSPATDELMAELELPVFQGTSEILDFILSDACVRLRTDPNGRRRRSAIACGRFAVDRMVKQYESLYESLK